MYDFKNLYYNFKINILKSLIVLWFFCVFLAVLSLRCCTRAFSSCFVAVRRLLIAVASLVAEHGL